jgi:hypothetical protein
MGSLVDFASAARERQRDASPPASSYGLVTELVDREEPARGREGVITLDGLSVVCIVEQIPVVGDTIRGAVPGIVEKVRITRHGRVLIDARPVPAAP